MDIFPKRQVKVSQEIWKYIFDQFNEKAIKLFQSKPKSFLTLLTHLLALYEEYFWAVPGLVENEMDLSLYDCARVTAALIAGLLKSSSNNLGVIVGDISGIQNYIFSITNIGSGGVAKRLRARSFYVNILSKAIAQKILYKFDLPAVNLIMSAAKMFYIMARGGEQLNGLILIQKELDRWFMDKFHGEVGVSLA